ncbi:MAG: response regulator transcription factor [Candidatus Omnitrophica bacterium]|nr:response regulator transcription factor [Candidatus Omnitrophota bacterium]
MAKKILIADDDKTLAKLMGSFLEENGYQVVLAYDGEEALKKVQYEMPDLILLDVVMPKINGYSFLFEVRKLEQGAGTPIIVLTSKEDMGDIFKVEGVKEYLVKPFHNRELLEKIKKHIG